MKSPSVCNRETFHCKFPKFIVDSCQIKASNCLTEEKWPGI